MPLHPFNQRFHLESQQVIVCAKQTADKYQYEYLNDVLLLIGILKANQLIEDHLKTEFEVSVDYLETFLEKDNPIREYTQIPVTKVCESVIEKSTVEQYLSGIKTIYPVHILLSLLRHSNCEAYKILEAKGYNYQKCLNKQFLLNPEYGKKYKKRHVGILENKFIYTYSPYWLLRMILILF